MSTQNGRIHSIDVTRGVAMILMAIDHVRVYAAVPAGGPNPPVFFTRWITNFVAPAFAFLSGTSAYMLGQRLGSKQALSRYLATRGLILVLLELTVIRIAWTFNFDFGHYLLAGVIWMLGWCMVLMAAIIWLPTRAIAAFGVAIIFLHNLMDFLPGSVGQQLSEGSMAPLWQILYFGGPILFGPDGATLAVLYSIVPWIGVMAAGYAFGAILKLEPQRRDRICITIGSAAIVLFLVLRVIDGYGDPRHWRAPGPAPALLRFINTTKYPASLDFLLMTLGPAILLVPLAERARGKIGQFISTFGRVPMFYYLLHIPTIHLAAVVVSLVRSGTVSPWLFANHPMMSPPPPDGYMWPLSLLYLVFIIVVAVLYWPSRWYARAKAERRAGWMRYI
ncbi:MAG: DUF1624 domain-containing protein [Gemmatimonadaceae bacterium]